MSVGASEEELITAVTESLDHKGRLSKLRAKIRSEVLAVLDTRTNEADRKHLPIMTDDVLMINELVREYFNWMDYKCASSMFVAESGMNESSVPRAVLMKQLNVMDEGDSVQVPILVNLVSTFKNMNAEKNKKS